MIFGHVFLVTDRKLSQKNGRSLSETVKRVLELAPHGSVSVQLREKDLSEQDLTKEAKSLSGICANFQAPFFVNRNVSVAMASRADGVHFPEDSSEQDFLSAKNAGLAIGMSAHSVSTAIRARELGVDFLFAGPMLETPAKRKYGPPLGPSGLQKIISSSGDVPVFAIGGINRPSHAKHALELGARGIAAIGLFAKGTNEEIRAVIAQTPTLAEG